MNIALFTDCFLPSKSGVVTVVAQLYQCLKEEGHHVIVVTVENAESSESEKDPDVYRVPSHQVGMGMKDQYFGRPYLSHVSEILKKNKIELIHCHTEFSMGIHAIHEARKCKLPLIVTTHTMWEDCYRFYLPAGEIIPPESIRFLIRRFYRHVFSLINVSGKAHDYFKQDGICPNVPSAVIPNAIPSENLNFEKSSEAEITELRHSLGVADGEQMMLFVGRVVEEKRVLELVDVVEKVMASNSKAKLVVVGDGFSLKHMQKLAGVTGFSDRFVFTGFIENSLIHKYYEAADVFVTASLSEMHSMTILEALTIGLPIVVRKDASYSDTVVNDFNGYQAETDEEMAEYIEKVLSDAGLREAFTRNGKELAKQFMPETFVKRHIGYYETVLKAWKEKRRVTDEELAEGIL